MYPHKDFNLIANFSIDYLLTMVVVSPRIHLSCLGDGETMESADSHVDDLLPAQALDDGRLPNVLI
jgi:hypothetical protein